jgi:UDP-GlcNAc:undecaprenyl-phosphate GlcNAc-1-phosphate transferase
MEHLSLIILALFIIYFINKYRIQISKITKLIDKPDKIRKLHRRPIPLLGGIMFFSTFILINFYLIFFHELTKNALIIFICCIFCLVLGLTDDIKKISYKYKFLFLIIIYYIFVSLDSNLQINKIYFSTFNKEFYLDHFKIPFTILCLLLLTNAINLIDGMDGLCILISIIFILWLINTFQNTQSYYIVLIISLIYILYLNLKKNIFLGDSGSLFLGSLIGLNILLNYNLEISKIHYPVENIFISLMVPGLDMLRVFAIRIINKKNPFLPDRTHLHHLLIARGLSTINILTIFFLLIFLPLLINFFTIFKPIYIIFFYILFYIFFILKLRKNLF